MFSYKFGSRTLSLNTSELWSIARGALIAAAGAGLTVLAAQVGVLDDGSQTGAILAAVAAVLVNAARKWVADNSDTPQ